MSDKAKELEQKIRQYADQLIEAVNEMQSQSKPEGDDTGKYDEWELLPSGHFLEYPCIIQLWWPNEEQPRVEPILYKGGGLGKLVRYKILRTTAETKAFLAGKLTLPIDSDEYEWLPHDQLPSPHRWVVVRLVSDLVVKVWTYDYADESVSLAVLGSEWEQWDIKDWRYCTPKELNE